MSIRKDKSKFKRRFRLLHAEKVAAFELRMYPGSDVRGPIHRVRVRIIPYDSPVGLALLKGKQYLEWMRP